MFDGVSYQGGSARNVHMCPVLPVVPFHGCCEEPCTLVDAVETTDILAVRVKDNSVCSSNVDADPVVAEAVGRVEVEDKHQAGTLKHDHLVVLVLQ